MSGCVAGSLLGWLSRWLDGWEDEWCAHRHVVVTCRIRRRRLQTKIQRDREAKMPPAHPPLPPARASRTLGVRARSCVSICVNTLFFAEALARGGAAPRLVRVEVQLALELVAAKWGAIFRTAHTYADTSIYILHTHARTLLFTCVYIIGLGSGLREGLR